MKKNFGVFCSAALALSIGLNVLSGCNDQYRFNPTTSKQSLTETPPSEATKPHPAPTTTSSPPIPTNPTPTVSPAPVPQNTLTESFVGSSTDRQVDLIFVVDSSGSMENVQNQLASNLNLFIQDFLTKSIDFRIGVITTDTYANENDNGSTWSDRYPGFIGPSRGCFMTKLRDASGNPLRFISSDTKDLAKSFSLNATVGTQGSGIEKGLHSLSYALAGDLLKAGACNAGFIREKALLSVVVISDENENLQTEDGDNDPNTGEPLPALRIARVRGLLDHAKLGGRYRLDFVINSSYAEPTPVSYPLEPPGGVYYNPDFYLIAAKSFQSKVYDIEAPKFGSQLAEIGSDIANQVRADFHLKNTPDVSTIQVTIDGTPISVGADGYVWIADKGVIHLQGKALELSDRRTVKITYKTK